MEKLKVIISGGGTGGHIFPAIAIADAIKRRFPSVQILFVGAENRMEMTRVPAAGYNIEGLPISGFDRKKLLNNIPVLFKLLKSLLKARKIVREFKPDIAIGVGGYASGPLLKAAAAYGVPTLIQEQNSYAGVTNKLLAKKAKAICVAYENMDKFFPKEKIILTGNPCRESLLSGESRENAMKYFNLDPTLKTILVVGGSLGARTVNKSIEKHLKTIIDSEVQIIWQSGEYYFHDLFMKLSNTPNAERIHLHAFLDRMDLAYKAADLVISRAGAGSISELCLLEKPIILVPSPNVAEDHQTKNAMALVDKDAAILVKDNEAEEKLISVALETVNNDNRLKILSENIAKLAQRNSANRIVDEAIEVIKNASKKV